MKDAFIPERKTTRKLNNLIKLYYPSPTTVSIIVNWT